MKRVVVEEEWESDHEMQVNYAHRNQTSEEGFDYMLRGKIVDGRRYLGHGNWQAVDHEFSETNERKEGKQNQ